MACVHAVTVFLIYFYMKPRGKNVSIDGLPCSFPEIFEICASHKGLYVLPYYTAGNDVAENAFGFIGGCFCHVICFCQ